MVDFVDPYAAAATNPYLLPPQKPDWMSFLGNALMGVGAGIGQADASGRGWASGIGPGLMYANQAQAQRQHQAEQEQQRRLLFGLQLAEFGDKRAERERRQKALEVAADEYAPGLRAPTASAVQMGPGNYDTKVAGLEGGTKNGGMVFNELGSGAYGPYQIMPSTWADIVAKNPNLNLPTDITKATREQHDAAHNAFKAGNAQALQAAGFQPTPDNLYLAHRFGVGGATSVLRADPNQSLAEILPIDWQRQNPDMRGQTAGGFRRLAAERVGGVGVPYEVPPNAKPTQYALMPDEMPLSIPGTGITSLLPRTSFPSWTAPVMPQPQGVVPAQYTPPQQAANVPPPAAPEDREPQVPPMPTLPPQEAAKLRRALLSGAITPEQAEARAHKIVSDMRTVQMDEFRQKSENYRFNRGQSAENQRFNRGQEAGEWELLDAKNAQMKLGPGYENNKAYLINKKGDIKPVGGAQTVVNIDQKTEAEFGKEMGKMDAKRFGEIIEAEGKMNDMASKLGFALSQFKQTYTGPGAESATQLNKILGAAGFEEASKKANAAEAGMAVISQMKPLMRAPGSGSSSDRDMDMFGRSLPNLLNLPGGNEKIVAYFQRMADRATQVRELAQEHSEGGKVPLTRTGFDAAVKKLGPLFTKDEIAEMEGLSKAQPQMPPPPPGFTVVTPGAAPNVPPPPAGFTVRP